MPKSTRFALLFLALALPACSDTLDSSRNVGPNPDQMRSALKDLLAERPDIDIPEFRNSLEHDPAVVRQGITYIGSWNCDPRLMTFEAVFTAPNVTMFEVSGRFQIDNRGLWEAVRRVRLTEKRDIGEFWRPHEVDTRF